MDVWHPNWLAFSAKAHTWVERSQHFGAAVISLAQLFIGVSVCEPAKARLRLHGVRNSSDKGLSEVCFGNGDLDHCVVRGACLPRVLLRARNFRVTL